MSQKDNVGRKKSTRWVKASTANYSGDDWSDDEEFEEEQNVVPKLPEINIENYDTLERSSPPTEIIQNFKKIDLGQSSLVYEDHESSINGDESTAATNHHHDYNYDGFIDGAEDDEEEEDYQPRSGRFGSIPNIQKEREEGEEDGNDRAVLQERTTSKFDPFPTDKDNYDNHDNVIENNDLKTNQTHEETPYRDYEQEQLREAEAEYEYQPEEEHLQELQSQEQQSYEEPHQEHIQDVLSESTSTNENTIPQALEPVRSQTYHLSEEPYDDDSPDDSYGSEEEDVANNYQRKQSVDIPLGETIESDDNDDDYVPNRYHFQSNSQELLSRDIEGPNEAQKENVHEERSIDYEYNSIQQTPEIETSPTFSQAAEIPKSQSPLIGQNTFNSSTKSVSPLIQQDHFTGNDDNISVRSPQIPEQQIFSQGPELDIPETTHPGDISDTDTLHIHPVSQEQEEEYNDNDNDDIQIIGEPKNISSMSTGSKDDMDFGEHAYLGDFINASPQRPVFRDDSSVESFVPDARAKDNVYLPQSDDIEILDTSSIQENTNTLEEEDYPSNAPTPIVNRDSQFYSSVNDYFDDYADEQQTKDESIEEEDESEPMEVEEQKFEHDDEVEEMQHNINLVSDSDNEYDRNNYRETDHLDTTSTHSSGSLSTGGPSIRSEAAYNRSSKVSDRTASFTNQSIQYQMDNIHDDQNDDNNQQTTSEGNRTLNPALSINFGHWRPNTDSFRDQFINDSSNVPPVPKLDNYTRNSRGEIVEEVNSITDSSKDFISMQSDADSLLSSAKEKNVETYRTESDSVIPIHISLDTPESTLANKNGNFHEDVKHDEPDKSTTSDKVTFTTTSTKVKSSSMDFKQIATLDNPSIRVERYKSIRERELNSHVELDQWIRYALMKVEVVNYTSPSSNIVKQAYAEASSNPKKFHHHNNLGSILVKKTFHDTSNTASSFAKGIFSRGKKIMKNVER